jgi:hypothetical protein
MPAAADGETPVTNTKIKDSNSADIPWEKSFIM